MQNTMIRSHPGVVALVSFAIVVAPLLVASEASAAVSIKRAELSGQNLRVEGQGARSGVTVTVTSPESTATARSDSRGQFKVVASNYRSSTCKATVSDGSSSVLATLAGCTPSTPPPPTTAPPPPPPTTAPPPPPPPAPAPPLALVALSHTSLAEVGTIAIGEVRLGSLATSPVVVGVTSSHPAIARITLGTTAQVASVQVEPGFDQAVFLVRHVAAVAAPTIVTITASAGAVTLTTTITINPDPGVLITADGALGPGFVGSDFTAFSTLGTTIALGPPAVGPVSWAVVAGQLPAGLSLADVNTSGTPAKHTWIAIVGTPTTVGTFAFSVRLTDANGVSRTGNYTVTVNPALTLVIHLQEPWVPVVGAFSNLWIDGAGGLRPYTWSVVAGALPPGMSLVQDNPSGPLVRVTGTPTTAGAFTFTLRLRDATGTTMNRVITITVAS